MQALRQGTHPKRRNGARRCVAAFCSVFWCAVLWCPGVTCQTLPPGERLQQLTSAEQSALDSNDPEAILSAAVQLGSYSLQLLGSLYTEQSKCGLASETFSQALVVLGDKADRREQLNLDTLLLGATLCAQQRQKVEQVEKDLLQAAGDTCQVRMTLGNVHHNAGDLPGAIREFRQAVSADTQSPTAHLALGDMYWELNEYQYNPESLQEYQAAVQLAPDQFYANFRLGAVLSEYHRYPEALAALQKAAQADPHSPDPWLQIGTNAYDQGQADEAEKALRKAIVLTAQDETRNSFQIRRAYATLSRLQAQAGNETEAVRLAQHEQELRTRMATEAAPARPLSESTQGSIPVDRTASTARQTSRDAPSATISEALEPQLKQIIAKSLNDAGTVYARRHDFAAALPLFQQAAASDPQLDPVMRNLGLAAFHTGAFAVAVDALTKALTLHPEDALAAKDLAEARAALSSAPHP